MQRPHSRWYVLSFAAAGFLVSMALGSLSIFKSTNSTAAVGFIFLPFLSVAFAIACGLLGYSTWRVVRLFKEPKIKPGILPSIAIAVSLAFAGWLSWNLVNGLVLTKVTGDIRGMPLEEVRGFLETSPYGWNKFALGAVLERKDVDADMLYKIANLPSPELHEAMGSVFPIMGTNTKGLAVMRLVALHSNVDARTLLILSKSPDDYVLGDVASNPKTPTDVLQRLYQKGGYLIEWGLADNPQCPSAILDKLAQSDNEYTRRKALETRKGRL